MNIDYNKEEYNYNNIFKHQRVDEVQKLHDECVAKIKQAMAGEIEWEDWMNGFLAGEV